MLIHVVKRQTCSPESPSGFYLPCSFCCNFICSLPEFLILREALLDHAILSNPTTGELLWVPSQFSLQSEIPFLFNIHFFRKTVSGVVCDALLLSDIHKVIQFYMHTHIFFLTFFSIMIYNRILNIVS